MGFIRHVLLFWQRKSGVVGKASLDLQRIALAVLGLFTAGLIVAEIVFRYFLNLPLMWVEELCLYIVFWLYFAGAIYATRERTHIKGGVLGMILKNKLRVLDWVQVGATIICFGVSCLVVVWACGVFGWNLQTNPRTVQMRLPIAYSQLSVLVGFAFMSFYFLKELIDSIHRAL